MRKGRVWPACITMEKTLKTLNSALHVSMLVGQLRRSVLGGLTRYPLETECLGMSFGTSAYALSTEGGEREREREREQRAVSPVRCAAVMDAANA